MTGATNVPQILGPLISILVLQVLLIIQYFFNYVTMILKRNNTTNIAVLVLKACWCPCQDMHKNYYSSPKEVVDDPVGWRAQTHHPHHDPQLHLEIDKGVQVSLQPAMGDCCPLAKSGAQSIHQFWWDSTGFHPFTTQKPFYISDSTISPYAAFDLFKTWVSCLFSLPVRQRSLFTVLHLLKPVIQVDR
jgi:hypothetical protein